MAPSKSFKVAAIQMVSGSCIEKNLAVASGLIAKAAHVGAQILVLPESFAVFGVDNIRDYAEVEESSAPIQTFLSRQAKIFGITLVGGTIARVVGCNGVQAQAGKSFAAVHTFGPGGELLSRYDKAHLFDAGVNDGVGAYCESNTYSAGESLGLVATPHGQMGVGVCYDLRFPEYFRAMQTKTKNEMTLLALPSAFTRVTGAAHWYALVRARAIETQCALIAANQGGDHGGGRYTYGHSCIVDAWGNVLAECVEGEGIAVANVDLAEQTSLRQKMPVFQHRKLW